MFELPKSTFWGNLTGSTGRKHNTALNNEKVDNINKVKEAGETTQHILGEYGKNSKAFAQKVMGEDYNRELSHIDAKLQQEKANALSRAGANGANVSSSTMFAQTKGEQIKQEALENKADDLENEALSKSLAPYQAQMNTAKNAFSMVSTIGKKSEKSVFDTLIDGGLSALGSSIPYF